MLSAAIIKEQRLKMGKTRRWLAEQIGVTEGTVYNWERGFSKVSPAKVYRLKKVLCLSNNSSEYLGNAHIEPSEEAIDVILNYLNQKLKHEDV